MRDSCNPEGVSDGSRLAVYHTLSSALLCIACALPFMFAPCIRFFILWVTCASLHPTYLCWHLFLCYFCCCFCCFCFSFLSICRFLPYFSFFVFCFMLPLEHCRCSSDLFLFPADHLPDWQPRILQGMVEARSGNVKNTHTHTLHTHAMAATWSLCIDPI